MSSLHSATALTIGLFPLSLIQLVTKAPAPALVTWGRLLLLRPVSECTQISRATQTPTAGHITHQASQASNAHGIWVLIKLWMWVCKNKAKWRLFGMSPIVPFEFNVTNDGFWGDTTATLDWCERNYEVSHEEWGVTNDLWVSGELVHCRVLQHSDKPGHDSARILRHTQSQKTQIGNEVNIVFRFKITHECYCR